MVSPPAARADNVQALAAVRQLSVEAVLALLEYLQKMTNLYGEQLLPEAPSLCHSVNHVVPSNTRVVEFVSHCIDVHFTRLAMLPSAHRVRIQCINCRENPRVGDRNTRQK